MASIRTVPRKQRRVSILPLAGALLWGTSLAAAPPDDRWPQFRGPDGTAVATAPFPPDTWSTTENVAWVRDVPGRGWSSPIVWEDRVFLTSAISLGKGYKEPSTGIYGNDYAAELAAQGLSDEEIVARVVARDIELTSETEGVQWIVLALDARTGEVLWQRVAHQGRPFGGRHRKNTYASETPATDGQRVFAYFGNVGLFAYSLEGDLLWEHRFEPQPIYLDFGTASSPVVHDGRVYVQHDNQESSFLAALDARTGEEIWRVRRGEGNESMIRSGWSTPFVWEHPARTEIVAVGHGKAIAYGLDGGALWSLSGLSGQATPTPLAGEGMLYVGTGSQGESNRPLFAVRPGASGDISVAEDRSAGEHVAWLHPRASAYTSSPLLYAGRIYAVNDNGILSVLDAGSGARVYRARVGGGGHTFSSSPWAYDGKVFFLSEDGDTFVAKASAAGEYEEVGRNSLDEMTLASPAVAGGALFLRTQTKLYCIREGR